MLWCFPATVTEQWLIHPFSQALVLFIFRMLEYRYCNLSNLVVEFE